MSPEPEYVRRRCARVLLADEDDRVLLFYSRDYMGPGVEYYVTPGGGLDTGETLAEGAVREVFEETGLRVDPAALGPVVAEAAGEWSDGPGPVIRSEDGYFFLRVPHFDPVRDRLEPVEQDEFTEARWLTLGEIAGADALVFPARIADLLKGLLAGTTPLAPVRLPWGAWRWDPDRDWTATERATILER
ncbi:NUDIX domain-containing protein [Glycomyces sp. TRM65418]|uniref:NUDIX hydrolase n=1 Tax=Glycomyces sp. TRM65418 TaxID=2867006 RepID=UPI001CE4F1F0|nr:NUDIX domain-containing protein [Glycomyces sp. TRM65418]MCC3764787.1 NUDIX domain-containing protein [Glycomyces sp. TRM65418]QZD54441.1 NUDIX domain-containing protein [Glycomyces sp. TRM65418]